MFLGQYNEYIYRPKSNQHRPNVVCPTCDVNGTVYRTVESLTSIDLMLLVPLVMLMGQSIVKSLTSIGLLLLA